MLVTLFWLRGVLSDADIDWREVADGRLELEPVNEESATRWTHSEWGPVGLACWLVNPDGPLLPVAAWGLNWELPQFVAHRSKHVSKFVQGRVSHWDALLCAQAPAACVEATPFEPGTYAVEPSDTVPAGRLGCLDARADGTGVLATGAGRCGPVRRVPVMWVRAGKWVVLLGPAAPERVGVDSVVGLTIEAKDRLRLAWTLSPQRRGRAVHPRANQAGH